MPFDDLDIVARRRSESDQVVAVIVVELRARVEQAEINLPVMGWKPFKHWDVAILRERIEAGKVQLGP
jgi:hypothetical protein